MKYRIIALGLLLAPVLFGPALAAPPEPSTYDVEVLVFKNDLPSLDGGEVWTASGAAAIPGIQNAVTIGDSQLDDTVLSRAATALTRDGHYQVLAYRHWQQTVEARSLSKPVRIRSADGELDGTLRFYLGRYYRIDLDLVLREPRSGGFLTGPGNAPPLVFRIDEHRRVRRNDINYFDHPKFGALVRITPAKPG